MTSPAQSGSIGDATQASTATCAASRGRFIRSSAMASSGPKSSESFCAVRSARARELLTEVQPVLIEALADTANPDLAFIGFDRFLSELPSGVQLFSLLKQNPSLIRLLAAIMGTAPRLARMPKRSCASSTCGCLASTFLRDRCRAATCKS